jgi:predicted O-linked N-acetylglucosamine transferase (SPINDLY family)
MDVHEDMQSPAKLAGYVTFASFNNPTKMNPGVISLWARILKALPRSRLVLKYKSLSDSATRERYMSLFAENGIASERIELAGWIPAGADHLALYHKADIALDTFPYNGTTTTCEALWMGLPVITLAGNRHAGRVGASLLTQTGLTQFIADTQDRYVELAVALATDLDRLASLRATLRDRVAKSALCDGAVFTRELEEAYRDMWQQWCARPQPGSIPQ